MHQKYSHSSREPAAQGNRKEPRSGGTRDSPTRKWWVNSKNDRKPRRGDTTADEGVSPPARAGRPRDCRQDAGATKSDPLTTDN